MSLMFAFCGNLRYERKFELIHASVQFSFQDFISVETSSYSGSASSSKLVKSEVALSVSSPRKHRVGGCYTAISPYIENQAVVIRCPTRALVTL